MAIPFVPVVAVCVVLLPLGTVSVNVTQAPEAGVPPLVTDAFMETVPGGTNVLPEAEMLTARLGGTITVALAVPDAARLLFVAMKFTA